MHSGQMNEQTSGAEGSRTPVPKQFTSRFYACVCGLIVVSADPRSGAHDSKTCKFSFRRGMSALWNQPDDCSGAPIRRERTPVVAIKRRERTACWQSLSVHAFSVACMLHDAPRQVKSVRSIPVRPLLSKKPTCIHHRLRMRAGWENPPIRQQGPQRGRPAASCARCG